MLETDEDLRAYGIDMTKLKPQVVAKLREKAAGYDDCIEVSMWLTYLVYQMAGAPAAPSSTSDFLARVFGPMRTATTLCEVCRLPLAFEMFEGAQRGRAIIETCHREPRQHSAGNVGFAHRECNIAQGARSVDEFYAWIRGILDRVGR
ncbi:MAG: hypothetical protein HND43_02735 [Armatimonadetes bacterium]|nr:hypothetical protein [Armatimonadota bacterium]